MRPLESRIWDALDPQLDGVSILVRPLQVPEVVLEFPVTLLVRFDLVGDLLVGSDHLARRVLGPTHAQRGYVLVVQCHLERLVVGGHLLEELPMRLEFLVEVGRRRVYPMEAIVLALVVCHTVLHAQLAVRGVLRAKSRAGVGLALEYLLISVVALRGVLLG